jgi:hypothetical protein
MVIEVKVRLLCNTHYGKPLKAGQEISVDEKTARRWIESKIAVAAGGEGGCNLTAQSNTQTNTSKTASTPKDGAKPATQTKKEPSGKQQKQ